MVIESFIAVSIPIGSGGGPGSGGQSKQGHLEEEGLEEETEEENMWETMP